MDFLSKVSRVKQNIKICQSGWGNKFPYLIQEFSYEDEATGEITVYISKSEHKDILKFIASQGHIKITNEEPDTVDIEVLPQTKPIIKPKALELIAQNIGQMSTGPTLIEFLTECGVDNRLI